MNSPADFVEKFINQTNEPVFLTGKAGTGKTTLLRKIVESTHKQTVIVAPTGIAALNAGGVTMHSFFQLPFAAFVPDFEADLQFNDFVKIESKKTLLRGAKISAQSRQLMRSLELLIIDEVSMLRADLLDAIDWTLRNVRDNNVPYGGVQVLFIGDLFQLPPVVKQAEWSTLHKYYQGIHFFNSHVVQEKPLRYIELNKIFRQDNPEFIEILNNLRNNELTNKDIELLNKRVNTDFDPSKNEGVITLTTHNAKANEMNQGALEALKGKSRKFEAEITGEFPPYLYPLDETLELKIGAQVMFIKNDSGADKRYYNGKMGKIIELGRDEIVVKCSEDSTEISVELAEWENIKYTTNPKNGDIDEDVEGTFVQYPLKLAWAITVHKSQGLTFDKAALEVSKVFAPGQAYVAFSRLRSLEGLTLLSPIKVNGLQNDQKIVDFSDQDMDEVELNKHLYNAKLLYLYQSLSKTFDWNTLANAWRSHEADYKAAPVKSEKAKHTAWAAAQSQSIQSIIEPSKSFRGQLKRILSADPVDKKHLQERLEAAVNYFLPTLDKIYMSNLKKMAEISRIPKTKLYLEELQELEQVLFECIIHIKKNLLLVKCFVEDKEVSKDLFKVSEIKDFRTNRLATVKQELTAKQDMFAADPIEISDDLFLKLDTDEGKKKKKKKDSGPKISTFEKTLEMFQIGKSIDEIAEDRKLSEKTIYGHLERLIKDEKLEVEEVLSPETLAFIKKNINFDEAESLTDLKNQVGEDVSWEELKVYRAGNLR
jgi:hypothetical protein